ncbi:phage tail protein [Clostridium botulinum]|nr:phage tail protein [Clostridium botulinum]
MPDLIGSKYYTVVTDIGQAKIANSIYSGKKLELALLKLGDGNGGFYNPESSQTNVKKEVWRGNVVDVEIDEENSNWINIYTVIPPTDGGYYIREMGVFDSDGDMIGICNCAETYKPIISDGSAKEITIKMTLAVVNISAITLKVDPTVIYAKRKDVISLTTKVNDITTQLKEIANDSYPIIEATGTNAYIGSTARMTKLSKGTRCTLFVAADSTGNCSLNLNNYGDKNIKDSFGNIVTNLKSNIPYNLCYNGSDFILQGKGGGGNLIPKYLLQGYYGDGDNGRVDGAMVNRGAPVVNLNCGGTFNLQEGYYSGGQAIANSLDSQTPGNATANKIMQGLTAWVNGSKIIGTKKDSQLLTPGTNYKIAGRNIFNVADNILQFCDLVTFSQLLTPGSIVTVTYTLSLSNYSSNHTGSGGIYVNKVLAGDIHYFHSEEEETYIENILVNPNDTLSIGLQGINSQYYAKATLCKVTCNDIFEIRSTYST